MEVKKNIGLKSLVFCAFCCAITCLLSMPMFTIPIGLVPITLGTVGVYLSGGLLGAKLGALAQLLYLILIFVGCPFTAGKTGVAVFLGYSGGFLIGYVFMAMTVGFLYGFLRGNDSSLAFSKKFVFCLISCIFGTFVCYSFGIVHFMLITRTAFFPALATCVYPFLIGDFLKSCLVSFVVAKLEKVVRVS